MHLAATTANVAPRSRSSIYNCSTKLLASHNRSDRGACVNPYITDWFCTYRPQPNRDSRFIFEDEVFRLIRFDPEWLAVILDSLGWP
jgi:hypothetical protein